jgi:hypothetical protein
MSATVAIARGSRPGRSALAVAAALLGNALLALAVDQLFHVLGVYPPWGEPMYDARLFLLALSYRTLLGVGSGWLVVRLAPSAPARHATVLGAIGTVFCAASVAATYAHPELGPVWYPIALTVIAYPTVRLGAAWHERLARRV